MIISITTLSDEENGSVKCQNFLSDFKLENEA